MSSENKDPPASPSASASASTPAQASASTSAAAENSGSPRRSQSRVLAKRFFSAYAETWVGLSPLWLMGEALMPDTKVGTKFKRGTNNLVKAAEDVRKAV